MKILKRPWTCDIKIVADQPLRMAASAALNIVENDVDPNTTHGGCGCGRMMETARGAVQLWRARIWRQSSLSGQDC